MEINGATMTTKICSHQHGSLLSVTGQIPFTFYQYSTRVDILVNTTLGQQQPRVAHALSLTKVEGGNNAVIRSGHSVQLQYTIPLDHNRHFISIVPLISQRPDKQRQHTEKARAGHR